MKKLLSIIFILPFLLGCKEKEYTGFKLTLEKDESGELTLADPNTLYDVAITNEKDCAFYIGDDACSSCQKLKPQLEAWVKAYKYRIYYIPVSSITEENVQKLYDATVAAVGYYQWAEDSSVPTTYFFSAKTVVFRGGADNTVNFLLKYVNVNE